MQKSGHSANAGKGGNHHRHDDSGDRHSEPFYT